MKKFEKLSNKTNYEVEKNISKQWEKEDILNKTIANRKNNKPFVFYDGPAYANGMPGVHHVLAKELKDIFCKYKTMQGYKVLRKVGWDTHGLPIEVKVEEQLGFNGKKDIEEYGIQKFNQQCRKNIAINEDAFVKLTKEMGQFIDTKNPYITCKNDYIETEWWILKKYFDAGLIYNGYKVLPYCPRCGTELASHEVAQEYKEITVNSVIIPFKLKKENTYLLIWTTTPWTLIANVAVCVNPKETYIKVESQGYNFIVAKTLANKILGDNYKILKTYKGKELEYQEYEQFMPFIKTKEKAFYITCDEFVTMEDGTGLVHLAPAFGQDDYNVAQKYNLPLLQPVGPDGCYTKGPWKGRFVVDQQLEIDIIKYLKENDKLFKKQKIIHNYPHCWRCKTPLIYFAKPSWYIKTTSYKQQIINANKTVNWVPEYIGEKRFGNWLENMVDWGISRNRYWGTPIPLWTCECGHLEMIGSVKELKEKSIEKLDKDIDLHRPYVDDIHIECPHCKKKMKRISDVLDVWFDSGSMPFAQYHYPFENKELFKEQYPADFIAEGVDQTRGWFYVLIVIGTFIMGKSPYKNVLVNDLLLDKNGQKMHKSRGNAIEPFSIIKKYGADTVRWYLPSVSPVWMPMKFDEDGLKETYSKFTSTLKNTYSFFEMYANADKIDPRTYNVPYQERHIIDKWLLSKANQMLQNVIEAYNNYNVTKAVKSVTLFLNDDLSNWYIRSNRRRFWASELTQDKQSVYQTLYEILEMLTKIIAPITPYISEEIYQKLTDKQSVHLADFPQPEVEMINLDIEKQMDLIRDICSLGRFAREDAGIKVRQPLQEILLPIKDKIIINKLSSIIQEELNIKKINYTNDIEKYIDYIVKPNFRQVGKMLGSKVNEFTKILECLTPEELEQLQNDQLKVEINNQKLKITKSMVIITMKAKQGYYSASNDNTFVILNTELTDNLILEGIARELVRKIQSMRKELDLIVTDRITIYYQSDQITKVLAKYENYIKNETLATDIIKKELHTQSFELNNVKVKIAIKEN